jgi:hypothetical protein
LVASIQKHCLIAAASDRASSSETSVGFEAFNNFDRDVRVGLRDLGFQPNALASSVVSDQTKKIALKAFVASDKFKIERHP